MKRLIFLAAFLVSASHLQAQISAEIGTGYFFESFSSDKNTEVPTALGLEVGMSYAITNNTSVWLNIERLWYEPFLDGVDVTYWDIRSSVNQNIFSLGKATLFGGVGVGYFWEKFDAGDINPEGSAIDIENRQDSYVGWYPQLGIQAPIFTKRLHLNALISRYFYTDKPGRIAGWYSIKLGLAYRM